MMWVAVCTQPNREALAVDNLRRQGYETYCPMVSKSRRHARKTEIVKRPLFPGYVFISLDRLVQGVRSIHSTFGVRHLVQFGDAPARLPEHFIAELKSREIDGAIPPPPLEEIFPQGSTVVIKGGVFKDFIATVLSCHAQDRLFVLLDMLKRNVKTSMPAEYLERA